jgi:hypothetical protein
MRCGFKRTQLWAFHYIVVIFAKKMAAEAGIHRETQPSAANSNKFVMLLEKHYFFVIRMLYSWNIFRPILTEM